MSTPFRILTVDNEPSIMTSLKYVFAAPRFKVLRVDSGTAAFERLESANDRYDLIIVDQKMPNPTGVELVDEIRKRGIPGEILSSRRTSLRKTARRMSG